MMKHLALPMITSVVALAAATAALPVRAEEHRGGGGHEEGRGREAGRFHEGGAWRGGHIERFHERDYHVWREGHWEHRYHGGRYGWWWIAAGLWYFYPAPIYPWPDPYAPPVVVAPPVVSAPEAAAPPPAQYWYYCDSAGGYYPYVPECPSGWRAVPATPAR
jgi:hypothetical protein